MIAAGEPMEVEIGGRRLALSRRDKVLWPRTGFTKGEMIDYYRAVAPFLLPHLANRPVTLARYPEGVEAAGWYQSNCRGSPEWMPVATMVGGKGQTLRYCLVNDEASLVWVANIGTIELHPFLAPFDRSAYPRALVFDLDPGRPAGIVECCVVALGVRNMLRSSGLDAYAKTSGAKGLHVWAPLDGSATYRETKAFARAMARELSARWPELVLDRMARAERAGKVFIDWGQNDPGKSTIAPYSLRATPWPLVSAPLAWAEVEGVAQRGDGESLLIGPADVRERLERSGDLFAPVHGGGQRLPALH